jgi:hypothetical protein
MECPERRGDVVTLLNNEKPEMMDGQILFKEIGG